MREPGPPFVRKTQSFVDMGDPTLICLLVGSEESGEQLIADGGRLQRGPELYGLPDNLLQRGE